MRNFIVAAALLCGIPPTSAAAGSKRDAMTNQGFLNLADDAFFAPALDLNPIVQKFIFSDFDGLALDAPRAVNLRARETLPVATLAVRRTAVAWDWLFREHTLLVASDVDRFRCFVDIIAPPGRPVLRSPPRPPPAGHRGGVGESAPIDARGRLQLPWEPATWQLLLLTRDLRSNAVRVTLRDGPGPAAPAPQPLPGAELVLSGSGKGLDTALDVKLKVRASRPAFPPATGAVGEVAIPVTFVVSGHERPAPYLGQRQVRGRFGPPGEPEHVVASGRATLREILPQLAGALGDRYYVWAVAGDQVAAPLLVDLRHP
jgi:hypothetical protein